MIYIISKNLNKYNVKEQLSKNLNKYNVKEQYGKLIILSLILSGIIFLPFLIYDKGLFLFYGDYNVQMVPFYKTAHEAVLKGEVLWNWNTDLGANFMGSYSYYMLGSPFFWIRLLFPNEIVPYLMAPILMLKFCVASVTSYAFIRRFNSNPNFAIIGALLYSFCGFNVYNIFFDFFNDIVAFFPLILIGLEEAVVNRRKGVFALSICLMAVINYFFFFGQVVFVIIYFILRCFCSDFKVNFKKFLALTFEAIAGVLASMVLLLPAILAITGNFRISEFMTGWDMLLYNNVQRYPLIIESLFLPPDIPARPNFFPDSNAKWASVSAYLPLFSMAGVITFFKVKQKHWIKRLLVICLFMSLIPILNSSFYAFNTSYYARWFYMPTLIMALATVIVLEKHPETLKFGIKWSLIITSLFALIGIIPAKKDGSIVFGGLPSDPLKFWIYIIIAAISFCLLYFILCCKTKQKLYKTSIFSLSLVIIIYSVTFITMGKSIDYNTHHNVVEIGLNGKQNINLPKDEFYRVDIYEGMDNHAMFWNLPTIQAFHSIVPPSIMKFYDSIGIKRDVASRPEIENRNIRDLLSVKYLFIPKDKFNEKTVPANFKYYDFQNEHYIYENLNFIPMGFTYDSYIDENLFEKSSNSFRQELLLKGILLNKKQIEKYKNILPEFLEKDRYSQSISEVTQKLKQNSSYEFKITKDGFTSKINSKKDNLLFFSVPYDAGWSAYVNGEKVEVENVNVGFMAVPIKSGENEIVFKYCPSGLKLGFILSIIGFILIFGYMFIFFLLGKKNPEKYGILKNNHKNFLVKKSNNNINNIYSQFLK